MAYRYEGGIDLSGALGTIAQGMEKAALMKRQQDQLAEAKIDDFLKMYQPGKLRTNDIPDFVNAYNQYKQSALNFSRMNRSGKDAESISAANVKMQKALGNLNDVYAKSSTAANKQAEYAEYFKTARAKGYEVPNEVSGFVNALTSSKLSDIDVDKIPSAYTFDLTPREVDLAKLSEEMDRTQAKLKEVTPLVESFDWGKDINGNIIKANRITKFIGRDPQSTVDYLTIKSKTNPQLSNAAKEDYSFLYQGVQSGSKAANEKLNEIKEFFPNVKTIDDVTPAMAYGLMFYRKQPQGTVIDDRAAQQAYNLAKDKATISQRQQTIDLRTSSKTSSDWHPSVVIKDIVETEAPRALYNPETKMNDLQSVDVSNRFKGYEIKDASGVSLPIDEVKYIGGGKGVEPYFRIRLKGNQDFDILQPKALNSRIVSAMGDINFSKGSVSLDNIGYKAKTKSSSTAKSINESQLAEKAKSSGYSVEEYTNLLKSKGIQIVKGK